MDETQKIFDTYEKIAEQYAVFTKFKPNNVHLERPAVRALVPDIQGAHVLDAGCGPGDEHPLDDRARRSEGCGNRWQPTDDHHRR